MSVPYRVCAAREIHPDRSAFNQDRASRVVDDPSSPAERAARRRPTLALVAASTTHFKGNRSESRDKDDWGSSASRRASRLPRRMRSGRELVEELESLGRRSRGRKRSPALRELGAMEGGYEVCGSTATRVARTIGHKGDLSRATQSRRRVAARSRRKPEGRDAIALATYLPHAAGRHADAAPFETSQGSVEGIGAAGARGDGFGSGARPLADGRWKFEVEELPPRLRGGVGSLIESGEESTRRCGRPRSSKFAKRDGLKSYARGT